MMLADLREAGGLTKDELVKVSGIPKYRINKYENGHEIRREDDLERISRVIADRLQIAYIAGLFDRVSSWTIVKVLPNPSKYKGKSGGMNTGPINNPVYSARVRFTTKHKILASVIEAKFGVGFVTYSKLLDSYCFFAANRKALEVAETLLPYLTLKRRQAELIIELTSLLQTNSKQGKTGREIVGVYIPSGRTTVFKDFEEVEERLHISRHSVIGCCMEKQKTTKNGTYTFYYGGKKADSLEFKAYYDNLEEIYKEMREFR